MTKGRIFVSVPIDDHLDDRRRGLKSAILRLVEQRGYEPQQFLVSGIPAGMSWNFEAVDSVMRRCRGAIILAFPRWTFAGEPGEIRFPTEYNHYEGALANAYALPTLTIAEKGIVDRGIAWNGGGSPILWAPADATADWLSSESFKHRYGIWMEAVQARRDVFLGYCSQAKSTAQEIHLFLTETLGLTVMNWSMDFSAGGTILEEIERAAQLCTCGVFLFTKDDLLESGSESQAAPRDNVVFEAGYFVSAKGKERVLVIRERGAKMPADIGGNIFLQLNDRHDTSAIQTPLRSFLEKRL
ncbi:MAG: nucleotide-binding protein [Gemmatimonadetes bacterium]|nr:nucleotide-binding protein [Gemmatimonadota bacterium]